MTLKRINREFADIQKEDLGGMKLSPMEENMFLWKGTIPGPAGSVYEGGLFDIEVLLPPDYPYVLLLSTLELSPHSRSRFSAPKAVFKTK